MHKFWWLIAFLILVAIVAALWLLVSNGVAPAQTLTIGEAELRVEIADTPEARRTGLSDRTELPSDSGMLFVFDEPGLYHFHMQDMQFPIDIIWMDEQKRVVDIAEDVAPESYPQTFGPSSSAQYVLEVNSGFSAEHGISRGARAELVP